MGRDTWRVLSSLATLGSVDLTTARTVEPHWDAVAILDAGRRPRARGRDLGRLRGGSPGHAPSRPGAATTVAGGCPAPSPGARWPTGSRTPWSPPTVEAAPAGLFAVDLGDTGVSVDPGAWAPRGLRDVTTSTVTFDDVPASPVGEPGLVPRAARVRLGRHRGGGRLVRRCRGAWPAPCGTTARTRPPDQVALMHLGACDVALHATLLGLRDAAVAIDAGQADGAAGRLLAGRVRAQAAGCAEQVLTTVGHALGPGTARHGPRARRARRRPHPVRAPAPRRARPGGARPAGGARRRATRRRGHRVSADPGAVPPHRRRHAREHLAGAATDWDDVGVLDLPAVAQRYARVLVLSAHPDDETLGVGGLLADLADAGAAVSVLVATDGERSHPLRGHPGPRRPGRPPACRGGARGAACWRRTARTTHLGLPGRRARPSTRRRWSRRCGAAPTPTPWCSPRGSPTGTPTTTPSAAPARMAVSHSGADLGSLPDLAVALGGTGGAAVAGRRGERDAPASARGASGPRSREFPSQTTAWGDPGDHGRGAGTGARPGDASTGRSGSSRPSSTPPTRCPRCRPTASQRRAAARAQQFDRMYDETVTTRGPSTGPSTRSAAARSCWPCSDAAATVARSRSVAPTDGSPRRCSSGATRWSRSTPATGP